MAELYILKRLEALRERLESLGCDAFFSIHPPTNQYLAGFCGSTSAIIVTRDGQYFFCDARYTEQAHAEVKGFTVEEVSGDFCERIGERLRSLQCCKVAFEPEFLSVASFRTIERLCPDAIVECPGLVTEMRCVKTQEEIDAIERAQEIAESVFTNVVNELQEGVREREVAARIDFGLKAHGDGTSFDTIVLFGSRSSLPHGKPTDARLQRGDVVLMDFGCRYGGYCSDLTRTFVFGSMQHTWFSEVYHVVVNAQEAALRAAKAGMTCAELDHVARHYIRSAGYGDYFGHGLGHGLGIEIHEAPRVNAQSDVVLRSGMVVTIEPGVYIPGKGGVRIEDIIQITDDGCRVLTKAPKNMWVAVR